MNTLKEEILTELERRVSLSCSSCQVGIEKNDRQEMMSSANVKTICHSFLSCLILWPKFESDLATRCRTHSCDIFAHMWAT